MLWNTLLLALRAIRRNLMRSFLTILGIVIGVAAVITMVTLGNGATQSVSDQISSMGSNLLMVLPGQRFGPGAEAGAPFKSADVEAIRNQITSAEAVAPVVSKSATAVYQANNWSTSRHRHQQRLLPGRQLGDRRRPLLQRGRGTGRQGGVRDRRDRARQAVRPPESGRQRNPHQAVRLRGHRPAEGQGPVVDGLRIRTISVVMPLRTVQRRLTGNQDINRLIISVKEGASIDAAKEQITLLLRERRNIAENEDDDFRVMDTRQIAETLTSTTKILTMLLGAVAAVSLLVGGIGIMNIMLVSVTERTREIGIRLAIGALEREVLLQFLIEAVVLSSLGGTDRHRDRHGGLHRARQPDERALPVRPRHQPAVFLLLGRHRRDLRLFPGTTGRRAQPDRCLAARMSEKTSLAPEIQKDGFWPIAVVVV